MLETLSKVYRFQTLQRGEARAEILNQMQYDAMAVGNHEFDFGLDEAKKYKEILKFPLLSSNIYVNGTPSLWSFYNCW